VAGRHQADRRAWWCGRPARESVARGGGRRYAGRGAWTDGRGPASVCVQRIRRGGAFQPWGLFRVATFDSEKL
jgi:hypothetical protein